MPIAGELRALWPNNIPPIKAATVCASKSTKSPQCGVTPSFAFCQPSTDLSISQPTKRERERESNKKKPETREKNRKQLHEDKKRKISVKGDS